MKVIKWVWQFPQNLLGLLVIFFTKAKKHENICWKTDKYRFGVSLGNYIIFGKNFSNIDYFHEKGHQIQSLYLGPLYLFIIGLPSLIGNIYDRLAHRNWTYERRVLWYYHQPWEMWADHLSGVSIRDRL